MSKYATKLWTRPGDATFLLARRCVGELAEGNRTVAVAESLTGGLLASALTAVPGSSKVLLGGVVAYSPVAKTSILGVGPEVMQAHGTVSREVAEAMANGARRALGADFGVATTGVAGPEMVEGKPLGFVCIACASDHGVRSAAIFLREKPSSDLRASIRARCVDAALQLLLETTTELG
jgi:nicotinamide-nucleotide amidase